MVRGGEEERRIEVEKTRQGEHRDERMKRAQSAKMNMEGRAKNLREEAQRRGKVV